MEAELRSALERLCSSRRTFDRVVRVLKAHQQAALPVLVRLLRHPDAGWSRGAAAALGRMRATPAQALPSLLDLLVSQDASVKISALSAMDWLPKRARQNAMPAVTRLLRSRPLARPGFTRVRAHLPRAVAAHFLSLHGGEPGVVALSSAARRRKDPILHHIKAALERARKAGSERGST